MKVFHRNLKDAQLIKTKALPASASSNVTTDYIDIFGTTSPGYAFEGIEFELSVPALSSTIVPDTKTVTYSIEVADDTAFTSPTTIATITHTGASDGGAPETALRAKPPSGARYVRGKVAFGSGTTSGAALSAEFAMLY